MMRHSSRFTSATRPGARTLHGCDDTIELSV
jgi:hypothetical protein